MKPDDHSVVEGETITLECRATGRPQPQLSWTKNDLQLPQDPRLNVLSRGKLAAYKNTMHNDEVFSYQNLALLPFIPFPEFAIPYPFCLSIIECHLIILVYRKRSC